MLECIVFVVRYCWVRLVLSYGFIALGSLGLGWLGTWLSSLSSLIGWYVVMVEQYC